MFGKVVTRYCEKCKKDVSVRESVGEMVDNKAYFTNVECPFCEADLSEYDRRIVSEARKNNKNVGIVMF